MLENTLAEKRKHVDTKNIILIRVHFKLFIYTLITWTLFKEYDKYFKTVSIMEYKKNLTKGINKIKTKQPLFM